MAACIKEELVMDVVSLCIGELANFVTTYAGKKKYYIIFKAFGKLNVFEFLCDQNTECVILYKSKF